MVHGTECLAEVLAGGVFRLKRAGSERRFKVVFASLF